MIAFILAFVSLPIRAACYMLGVVAGHAKIGFTEGYAAMNNLERTGDA